MPGGSAPLMDDPITAWISAWKIPLGRWGRQFFEFLTANFAWFFDNLALLLSNFLNGMVELLLAIPASILVLVLAALAYALQRSWRITIGTLLGLAFIINRGLWREAVETLVLVVSATAASMAIGVPIGIWAAHNERVYGFIRPVLDLMQTLPTFVYLIPVLILFGLGAAPGLIVTVIFAAPAPIRLTYLGIKSVPVPLREAGLAFGATKLQLLRKVELPAALPSIMAGMTQCIMLSLSMVVIAALIGANGLGKPVVRALNSVNIPLGIESGLAIVVLAIILDRITRLGRELPK